MPTSQLPATFHAVLTAPVQTWVVPAGAATGHITVFAPLNAAATLPVAAFRLLLAMVILLPVPVPPIWKPEVSGVLKLRLLKV